MTNETPAVAADRREPVKGGGFRWTFQRLGGLEQVVLRSAEDLRRLRELDPKLWVALSCPASGLEFDSRTLSLIDKDRDDRIRIPEVLDAVEWISARLKDPALLMRAGDAFPLDAIDDSTEEGRRLAATARAILRNQGKPDATSLTQEDVAKSAAHASEHVFNGDGVLPPHPAFDKDVQDFIVDAMAVTGSVEDASGRPGINREIADAFMKTLAKWLEWRKTVEFIATPVGGNTPEAWELLSELSAKIDDYFLRCEFASYAPETVEAPASGEKGRNLLPWGLLDAEGLLDLPISRVEADRPLIFSSGLNPAWRRKIRRLAELLAPLLPSPEQMSREDWESARARFASYGEALTMKPVSEAAGIDFPPTSTIDKLGEERIRGLLSSDVAARFAELAGQDAAAPAAAADIAKMERMVLYHKHLYRLLTNFVSFEEFFSLKHGAAFQAGTLYIDGRACRLCILAEKVEEHSTLASNSQLYLLYCACRRGRKPGSGEPLQTMGIVAAVTAGDSDFLMLNRNGVFVDNKGDDWDATVVKIVGNPIGLWQAVWSPYKKFGSMITEHIGKFASDRNSELMAAATRQISAAGAVPTSPPSAAVAPQRFDIGRNIGIFAAVGIALGAIGTAVGSIARALLAMEWWQFPVLLLGLFAIVSGPSLIIAWLKLRQRTLGPLLEASGWAINGRISVNYMLSRKLTSTAALPARYERGGKDPLARIQRWRVMILAGGIALGSILWFLWRWRAAYEQPGRSSGAAAVVGESPKESEGSVFEELESILKAVGNSIGEAASKAQGAAAIPSASVPAAPDSAPPSVGPDPSPGPTP